MSVGCDGGDFSFPEELQLVALCKWSLCAYFIAFTP